MARPVWVGWLTGIALLPAFLLFGGGDALSLHVCPHHLYEVTLEGGAEDDLVHGAHVLAHDDSGHHDHGAGHDRHHDPDSPASESAGSVHDHPTDDHHDGPCSCAGDCHAGGTLPGLGRSVPSQDLLLPPRFAKPRPAAALRPSLLLEPYVLPYATPPPLS